MASEDRVLGRIGITLKGEYDNNKTYTKLNQVTHQGGSYTLKVAKAKGILPTNEDYWICSARPGEKGDKGDKGEKGDTGAQGPQGEQGIQGIQGEQGEKGDKGDKPVSGVDYFTEEEKTEFKNAVVAESKEEIETAKNGAIEDINTAKDTAIADYDEHVKDLTERVDILEKRTGHIYGIKRKITDNTASTWERIGDSVGLVANARKATTEAVQNDFSARYPWNEIKTCNIDANGNVTTFIGEPRIRI